MTIPTPDESGERVSDETHLVAQLRDVASRVSDVDDHVIIHLAADALSRRSTDTRTEVDAERWRALMCSQRIRVMGSAGFMFDGDKIATREGGYMHLGVELWNVHAAAHPSTEIPAGALPRASNVLRRSHPRPQGEHPSSQRGGVGATQEASQEEVRLGTPMTTPPPGMDIVSRTLAFFASVIKSGESWTPTCQAEYEAAQEALTRLRRAAPEWQEVDPQGLMAAAKALCCFEGECRHRSMAGKCCANEKINAATDAITAYLENAKHPVAEPADRAQSAAPHLPSPPSEQAAAVAGDGAVPAEGERGDTSDDPDGFPV